MGGSEYRVGPSPELVKAEAASLSVERGGITYPKPLMIEYPNGNGSGHAGNATSQERQQREDASGLTLSRQAQALAAVQTSGAEGVTVAEAEGFLSVGHGQASSALSHLHRAGRITRLKDRRRSQEIYVAPEHVNGRKESPYNARPQRKHPKFHSDATVINAMKVAGLPLDEQTYDGVRRMLENLP